MLLRKIVYYFFIFEKQKNFSPAWYLKGLYRKSVTTNKKKKKKKNPSE